MAQAGSISLSKFTTTVQAAVKAAVQKHPKFRIDLPHGITVSYLIRGVPVPDALLANVTLGETQAFANDVAAHIGAAHPEAFGAARGPAGQGAILSIGRHVIVGIPPLAETVIIEK
jgi:hypothetical protein